MRDVLSFLGFRSRRRAQKLYEQAHELVDDGLYDDALVIARKLRKLHYSGAFEIEGMAYEGLGRNEDAVRVLREGLAKAPGVWLNWHVLGHALSNLGRYDEALLAYDRAESCEQSDRSIIDLNRAIVANRREDYESTLRFLDRISGYEFEGMRLRAVGTRLKALHGLHRDGEAEDLGVRTLNQWRDTNETEGKEDIGEIALIVGEIRLARGEDREALFTEAVGWWRDTRQERLLWLLRELRPRQSPHAHYFRLMLDGIIGPNSDCRVDAQGFRQAADVVGDSAEEAFALLLEVDPPEAGVEVTVDEANAIEPCPDGPKGVYWISGRVYYSEA